ncbi:molybdopterin-binding protein [Thermaurantiacus sp.]
MIFGPVPLERAEGALLAHGLTLGRTRFAKGIPVTPALIEAARAQGLATLLVARAEAGDVGEDEAAARLAARLAGPGLEAAPPSRGRANLRATAPGLLLIPPGSIAAVNAVDPALTVGTLPAFAPVAAGEIVATIKVIPYFVRAADLARALEAARPLEGRPFRLHRAHLVQTRLPGTSPRLLAKTGEVTRARLAALGAELRDGGVVPHATDALAAALACAAREEPGLLLVAGASATIDAADTVPAAIRAAGGTVVRVGMPVDPGNLLVLGRIGRIPIVGLPGCARSPKRNGLDLVLERIAAGLEVAAADIAAMGEGGLLAEGARPMPRA